MDLFRTFTKKLFEEELLEDLLMDDNERRADDLEKQLEQTKIQLRKAQMELVDLRMSERSRIGLVKYLAESKEEYMDICNKQFEQLECIKETQDDEEVKPDCGVSAELKLQCGMLEMEKRQLLEENEQLMMDNGELLEENAQLREEMEMMKEERLQWEDAQSTWPEWVQLPTYQDFAHQMNNDNQQSPWDGFSVGYGPDEMAIRRVDKVNDEIEDTTAKVLSMLKIANKQMEQNAYNIY